ncbi:response regulator [Plantibacter cousiniae (nom. nud.)]|uniref:Two component transcriptional regulator, LuxR family n=1 Tax=Plantibacter cousiniae (nom. nud.) TaxID=199709 RepID=A0ABY1LQ07_9MICO|nr:response regulator transcription factor [Plantibacter cousiniae]SKC72339.1 two component transcriptional regulator, LuxR family [Plantibacter cousiniae]
MTITVLIADDHAAVRAGLGALLDEPDDILVIAEAADGEAVVAQAVRHRPDVVLLDVQMPRASGIDAIPAILAAVTPPPSIIMLTTFALDRYVDEALAAGANAFLVKTVSAAGLVDAIRRVHAGEAVLAPEVTRRVLERLAAARPPVVPAPAPAHPGLATLTPREREVLEQLREGLSNAGIATALGLSEATARTHVSRILVKLDARSRVQAALIAERAAPGADSSASSSS